MSKKTKNVHLNIQAEGLSGKDIVDALLKGHAIRRKCWVDGFFIRICNEAGFAANKYAVLQPGVAMYTIATSDYFCHFAHSSQPFNFMHYPRDGEGLGDWLLADDWEDYGFVTREYFDQLTEHLKDKVRKAVSSFRIGVG